MSLLIKESKRDDYLMPYFEMIRSNGIDIQFGEFKSALLQKFSSEAGMHNLSLRSNYYVAGVARYYFNGDLTTNKQVALLTREYWDGGRNLPDNWNTEVCQSLDKIILLLRNSYIDSVGTSMELAEDFGNLSIKKLLRKYGGKIKKLSDAGNKDSENDGIDRSSTVGKGYTFEIMYSQEDCQKYERPTAPGSWCITYGKGHYDAYVRRLNIHYVIFRMNGWEKVQRPSEPENEPGFTRQKPHDLYGNSLIALLQSNTSPEPVYITSRWNHGYEVHCEADHAYTKEEFQQITGVTDDDLKRIYKIWKADCNIKKTPAVTRKEVVDALRVFKYAQMRINAGENPSTILTVRQMLNGSEDRLSKSLATVELAVNDTRWVALFDRNKIILETITPNDLKVAYTKKFNFALLRPKDKVHMIYDGKRRKLLNVDGAYKFKYGPDGMFAYNSIDALERYNGNVFFLLKQSRRDNVLVSVNTLEPLKLPNGESWFNMAYCGCGSDFGDTACFFINPEQHPLLEIIYDESSYEKYFFDVIKGRFINMPEIDKIIPYFAEKDTTDFVPIIDHVYSFGSSNQYGYTPIQYVNKASIRVYGNDRTRYTNEYQPTLLFKDGKIQYIDGKCLFYSVSFGICETIFFTEFDSTQVGYNSSAPKIYDLKNNKLVKLNGKTFHTNTYNTRRTKHEGDIAFTARDIDYTKMIVYNTNVGEFYHFKQNPERIEDYLIDTKFVRYHDEGDYDYLDLDLYLGNNSIKTVNMSRNDVESMVNEAVYRIIKRMLK